MRVEPHGRGWEDGMDDVKTFPATAALSLWTGRLKAVTVVSP